MTEVIQFYQMTLLFRGKDGLFVETLQDNPGMLITF